MCGIRPMTVLGTFSQKGRGMSPDLPLPAPKPRTLRLGFLLWIASAVACLSVYAVGEQNIACPAPQPYKYLRYDEDYHYLQNATCRSDPYDQMKYVPLDSSGESFVSFGGEI